MIELEMYISPPLNKYICAMKNITPEGPILQHHLIQRHCPYAIRSQQEKEGKEMDRPDPHSGLWVQGRRY